MEDQLEASSRGRDEALKQLRKIQVSKLFYGLLISLNSSFLELSCPNKVLNIVLNISSFDFCLSRFG